jgi:hypothetical protein
MPSCDQCVGVGSERAQSVVRASVALRGLYGQLWFVAVIAPREPSRLIFRSGGARRRRPDGGRMGRCHWLATTVLRCRDGVWRGRCSSGRRNRGAINFSLILRSVNA